MNNAGGLTFANPNQYSKDYLSVLLNTRIHNIRKMLKLRYCLILFHSVIAAKSPDFAAD